MNIHFTKYQSAGNDFVLIDNREGKTFSREIVEKLCSRRFGIGADGMILLEKKSLPDTDFRMRYYNSDGNESTMCGNGGMCIVHFAWKNGLFTHKTTFSAVDGIHHARIEEAVHLQMNPVEKVEKDGNDFIIDTGSPHFVRFVKNVDDFPVFDEGKKIRYSERFATKGINVNFAEIIDKSTIKLRTYERGVEDETLSCGTGSIASSIATCIYTALQEKEVSLKVVAPGGTLQVDFTQEKSIFGNIILSNKVEAVFSGIFPIAD